MRQTTVRMLKAEQEQLAAAGMADETARVRYREISAQLEKIRVLAEKEAAA